MATDPIHAIADRLMPAMRAAFLAAVRQLRAHRLSVEALAKAVSQGSITLQIDEALGAWPEDLKKAVAVINQVFRENGEAAGQDLTKRFKLSSEFEVVNPRQVDAARQHTATLVREITDQTRASLRTLIADAVLTGTPPAEAARQIRELVGLTERQAMAVVHYRKNLLEAGATPENATKAADQYAAKLLRQRALTIARTEMIRAGNLGRQATWQEARERGYLPPDAAKRWVVTEDDRLCPVCRPLDGQEVPLDGLFVSAGFGNVSGPPLHPNCRCTTTLVIPRRASAAA